MQLDQSEPYAHGAELSELVSCEYARGARDSLCVTRAAIHKHIFRSVLVVTLQKCRVFGSFRKTQKRVYESGKTSVYVRFGNFLTSILCTDEHLLASPSTIFNAESHAQNTYHANCDLATNKKLMSSNIEASR